MTTAALTLSDIEERARERLHPSVWDFFAGGAGEEETVAANLEAFRRVRLRPSILRGASSPQTGTGLLGVSLDAPLLVAPLAYQTLAHPEGELATVQGTAAAAHVPVVISTFAGRTVEELAEVATVPLWLQVYCFRDRSVTQRLIERAERAGFGALVLTVDTPRLGRRLRDLRNDFRLPAEVVPANLIGPGPTHSGGTADFAAPAAHASSEFDPDLDWSVIEWLNSVSSLPIILKGILTGSDAELAVRAGADAIVVSNHGGRQLDGVPACLSVLPEIAAAVQNRIPVLVDGGIRRGRDILAALAMGARAVLVGRPVMHGLAIGGEQGVAHVLTILISELTDAMTFLGLRTVREVGPYLVHRTPAEAPY